MASPSPAKTTDSEAKKENPVNSTRLAAPSRGYLLWKSLINIRKCVAKVSEPMSKGRRRSLRRQLSFEVDGLERAILGAKPLDEDCSETLPECSEDEEMREEVEAIVKDAIEEASSTGKMVSSDYFENRMKRVEAECAELKKKLAEMSRTPVKPKRMKSSERGPFSIVRKSPKKSKSGYASDHGYEGSLDHTEMVDASSKKGVCSVCGKFAVLAGWRCVPCRGFWNRLIKMHAKGKLLPFCDHWEPTSACKGCHRRKFEAALAIHAPDSPLGIPPCPPTSCPVDEGIIMEQSRQIDIEYW